MITVQVVGVHLSSIEIENIHLDTSTSLTDLFISILKNLKNVCRELYHNILPIKLSQFFFLYNIIFDCYIVCLCLI